MAKFIDSVNAFSHLIDTPTVMQDGLLKEFQFAVKDVFDIQGFRVQAGNPQYFDQANIADKTAPAISILQKAGAQLLGKTHTDELGGSLFGMNTHYGPPLNSYSPEHVPGGSSSGSAAAVAAKLVDFSLGADTSGSVRAPASFCGIYGIRPTLSRIPTVGVLPISQHLDTVGLFSPHPDIISQVLDVYGLKEKPKLTRLRVIPSLVSSLEGSLRVSFLEKLDSLKTIIPSSVPLLVNEDLLVQWSETIRTLAMYGLWQEHQDWITKSQPAFGKMITDRLKQGRSLKFADYKLAAKRQDIMKAFMDDHLEPGDVAVFPTVHDIAPRLSSTTSQLKDFALKASRHTCIAALAGLPEITVPLRNIKGNCSIGVSLLGKAGTDRSLAALAAEFHSALHG